MYNNTHKMQQNIKIIIQVNFVETITCRICRRDSSLYILIMLTFWFCRNVLYLRRVSVRSLFDRFHYRYVHS